MNTKYVYALQCKDYDGNIFIDIIQTQNRILTVDQLEEIEREIETKNDCKVLNINFLHQIEED